MTSRLASRVVASCLLLAAALSAASFAQEDKRPASPPGSSATQIGEAWIDVTYSRPILRGRKGIFGSGAEYGKKLYANGPLWRVGANATTRIKTGLDLEIGGKRVPAGEYSFFIELKEGAWTGILSTQPYMETPDRAKMAEGITWGAYGYKPEFDVVRAPMTVETRPNSAEQLAIGFQDVTAEGGVLIVVWDNQLGRLPFKVAK